MPKVAFKTLGCRLNQAETDQIAEDLTAIGFDVVAESDGPDVVIVNTCCVTQEASRSSRRTALKAASNHPNATVVVAGCYAALESAEARSLPGVAIVSNNDEKEHLAQIIARRLGLAEEMRPDLLQISRRPSAASGRTRANLKVQTGCDEWCTFCIIPRTRGPLRSYELEDILSRSRQKVADGARELVLTGVHLGKYGWDLGKPDDHLVALLEGLLDIEGLARIRLSSILSRHLTDRVVALIACESRICRFLHVPLQSGDDAILERMNRPYRIGEYMDTIERVKSEVHGLGLSTDVIVGFPGETDQQFGRTMDVCAEAGFLKMHVFRFSARSGTPSATFAEQVPEEVKRARSRELIARGNEMRLRYHGDQVGKSREIFVEEAFDNGELAGHTDDFVKAIFKGPASLKDGLARVAVTEARVDSVRAELQAAVDWTDADPRDLVGSPSGLSL